MKKIFVLILAIVALSSCGVARKCDGNGYGESTNKNIAQQKAFVDALGRLSIESNADVTDTKTLVRREVNGNVEEVYSDETVVKSATTFTNSSISLSDYRGDDGVYHATANVKGKAKPKQK